MLVNLTGKSQEQRLQDNRIRVSFVTFPGSNTHFCRNSREPPYPLACLRGFRKSMTFDVLYPE